MEHRAGKIRRARNRPPLCRLFLSEKSFSQNRDVVCHRPIVICDSAHDEWQVTNDEGQNYELRPRIEM